MHDLRVLCTPRVKTFLQHYGQTPQEIDEDYFLFVENPAPARWLRRARLFSARPRLHFPSSMTCRGLYSIAPNSLRQTLKPGVDLLPTGAGTRIVPPRMAADPPHRDLAAGLSGLDGCLFGGSGVFVGQRVRLVDERLAIRFQPAKPRGVGASGAAGPRPAQARAIPSRSCLTVTTARHIKPCRQRGMSQHLQVSIVITDDVQQLAAERATGGRRGIENPIREPIRVLAPVQPLFQPPVIRCRNNSGPSRSRERMLGRTSVSGLVKSPRAVGGFAGQRHQREWRRPLSCASACVLASPWQPRVRPELTEHRPALRSGEPGNERENRFTGDRFDTA